MSQFLEKIDDQNTVAESCFDKIALVIKESTDEHFPVKQKKNLNPQSHG